MTILLKLDWKSKVSAIKPQNYFLGNKVQHVIDDIFDEMYK